MNDEQMRFLVKLCIVNDERIAVLADTLGVLLETAADAADWPGANPLRCRIEQMQALSRDAAAARELARKYFGI